MHLSNSALSVLAVAALALSVLALLIAGLGGSRNRRPRQDPALPQGDRLELLVENQAKQIQRLEGAVRQLAGGERKLAELLEDTIRHVGVVRFDAFEDMGGRLSFSAAFMNGHGDGIVITSINGRQDTRCYAKQVRGGSSVHNLSDEEEQAIREALAVQGGGTGAGRMAGTGGAAGTGGVGGGTAAGGAADRRRALTGEVR
jgi:hypothetical protein